MTRSVVASRRAHFGNRGRDGFGGLGGNANGSRYRRLVGGGSSLGTSRKPQLPQVAPHGKRGHRGPSLRQGAALGSTPWRPPNSQRGPPSSVVSRPAPGPWRPATCTARTVRPTQRESCIRAQAWGFERTRPTFSWAWPRRTPSRGRWRPVVGGQRKSRPSAAARWPACCQNVDTGAEQPPLPRPGLQPALASAAGHPRRVARVQGANRLKSGTIVLMTRATKTVLTNRCVMRKIMNGWILAVVGNSSRCCQRFNMSASSSCVSRVGDVRRTHTYACICRH